jgi:mono/diheme cytochrome c family protein
MVILGFAALREPARLTAFALAEEGRSIENGARIYFANCAACHGVEGRALTCFDAASSESIDCVGLPLNNPWLICGDTPVKLGPEGVDWEGTKRSYIEATVASGRPGTQMSTWSEEFGGPLRDDQIRDVASFVLNWEGEWFVESDSCGIIDPGPWPETVEEFLALDDIDPGDAANGELLYTTHTCIICHGNMEDPNSATIGPWLGDIAARGNTQIPGQSAAQYIYRSILYPNEFIAPDCPTGPCFGPPSAMRQTFALDLLGNPQELADFLAYLLAQ